MTARAPIPTPPADDIAGHVHRVDVMSVVVWIDGYGLEVVPVVLGRAGFVVRDWGAVC